MVYHTLLNTIITPIGGRRSTPLTSHPIAQNWSLLNQKTSPKPSIANFTRPLISIYSKKQVSQASFPRNHLKCLQSFLTLEITLISSGWHFQNSTMMLMNFLGLVTKNGISILKMTHHFAQMLCIQGLLRNHRCRHLLLNNSRLPLCPWLHWLSQVLTNSSSSPIPLLVVTENGA